MDIERKAAKTAIDSIDVKLPEPCVDQDGEVKKVIVTKDIKIYKDPKRERGTLTMPAYHKAVFFLISYHKSNGRRCIKLTHKGGHKRDL